MSSFPSTFNLVLNLGEPTLAAINGLAAAISSAAGSTPAAVASTPVKTGKGDTAKNTNTGGDADNNSTAVTIWWRNPAKDEIGTVDSEDAFKALKKKDAKVIKITEQAYDKFVAEREAAANKPDDEGGEDKKFTQQDLIDAFGGFLDPTLDEDEKADRRKFVAPLVKRFGAKKASEIAEEHRALALNLLARKIAGQDVDPENDEFEEIDEEASLV